MLRKLISSERLKKFRPLFKSLDTFLYEVGDETRSGPSIRDSVDQKRWMILVVLALLPCTLMAVWNTGVQTLVFGSGNAALMSQYVTASGSLSGYFSFCAPYIWPIIGEGLLAFLPVLFISYLVGGIVEVIFAVVRGHEVSEGFLVSGILFALILPPTIPYWLVALGVASGIFLSKELFGGSGMNILNPALTCRCLLYFAYPTKMAGEIWVGTNPTTIRDSLFAMNQGVPPVDGVTQASPLGLFNIPFDVKRIHIDAIATFFTEKVRTLDVIKEQFLKWSQAVDPTAIWGDLTLAQIKEFVTAGRDVGGLGLSPESFTQAFRFVQLKFGSGVLTDGNFFLGNRIGSMGETSVLACLFGGLMLVYLGIGAWRTMVAMGIGGLVCAVIFEWASTHLGIDGGRGIPLSLTSPPTNTSSSAALPLALSSWRQTPSAPLT